MHLFVSVVAIQKPIKDTLPSLSPRSWGRNIMALSSFWHPRSWTQTTCHHPITLPAHYILVCCVRSMGFHSGELHIFLESRAMRMVSLLKYKQDLCPFPGARHPSSEAGEVTEGAFCDALPSEVGRTREIPSPSW